MTRRGESVELAVLGLLHESPLHGYELRKRLSLVLGWGRLLSYGSLYPTLKTMLRAGWIREDGGTTPPTSPSVGRRPRIVYALTPQGDEHFAQVVADAGPAAWEDDNFGVRFAFFGRTDKEIRLRILEGRRARLEERISRLRGQLAASQAAPRPDRYAAELQRHGLESVEREVTWLTGLITAERHRQHPASD